MTRNFFYTCIFALSTTLSFGQIQKGNLAIGGSASFNINLDDGGGVNFFLSPNLGKFVTDKLLIGGNLGFSIYDGSVANSWSISGGPAARYYLSVNEKLSPFLSANVNYIYNKFDSDFLLDYNGFATSIGGGLSFHLNEHITLDAIAVYNYSEVNSSNAIRFLGGFSAFLGGGEE